MSRPIIGITLGDPAGIGPEIVVKSLANPDIYKQCIPIVIGNSHSLAHACQYCGIDLKLTRIYDVKQAEGRHGCIEYIDLDIIKEENIRLGQVSAHCGEAAFQYIIKGIDLANENAINAVVTAPINKEAINLAGHHFAGHTEIFAHYTDTKPGDFAMMLASGDLRVVHVTTHVSVRQACDLITKERVLSTIRLAWDTVKMMGIANPLIGVAGLNPHASESGLFGHEEEQAIIPAIEAAQLEGICVAGPVPADTVFVKALGGAYSIVIAMYHDQGHIPLKLHGFRLPSNETEAAPAVSGINMTIGLPIIRTSVDHGTAFDLAGKNRACHQSLTEAIEMAVVMAKGHAVGKNYD